MTWEVLRAPRSIKMHEGIQRYHTEDVDRHLQHSLRPAALMQSQPDDNRSVGNPFAGTDASAASKTIRSRQHVLHVLRRGEACHMLHGSGSITLIWEQPTWSSDKNDLKPNAGGKSHHAAQHVRGEDEPGLKESVSIRSMSPPALATRFPCVSMAPLGTPVVPEVKQMSARSLGDGGMWARGCSLPRLITSSKRRILHELRVPCGRPGKYCPFFAPYTACAHPLRVRQS